MRYRSVGVIGGGTAGYISAIALKKLVPGLDVTLIESKHIPIIGVGEATTPFILSLLHQDLKLDITDFYLRVQPTWKLGIKFFWGRPGEYYFNYPFGKNDIAGGLYYDNDVLKGSLTSLMMRDNRGMMLKYPGDRYRPLLDKTRFAYHLDNGRFVNYLKETALELGVRHLERTISGVSQKPNGDIEAVVDDAGQHLQFDLFIDCSGFRSLILGNTLKDEFISYKPALFTDSAIVANVPNHGFIKPYTLAESMDHGWCWNIAMRDADHRGYVYASEFCSADEAHAEMKRKNPEMGEARQVRFRSGRHRHFWRHNVVAVGNSYGFVEPLESTGIHMILMEITEFIRHFPKDEVEEQANRILVNYQIGNHWDYLRDFLALHYKFNHKFETDFWKTCHRETQIGSLEPLVDLFQAVGPLSYITDEQYRDILTRPVYDDIFGLSGIDHLLFGQGLRPKKMLLPTESEEHYRQRIRASEVLLKKCLPQRETLELLEKNHELLVSNGNYSETLV